MAVPESRTSSASLAEKNGVALPASPGALHGFSFAQVNMSGKRIETSDCLHPSIDGLQPDRRYTGELDQVAQVV